MIIKKTFALLIEDKDIHVLKKDGSKSKAIIKNQLSFSKNYEAIRDTIAELQIDSCIAVYEQLTSRPAGYGTSNLSTFSLADSGATIRAVFNALHIPYFLAPPATWKKYLGVTSEKATSIDLFNEMLGTEIINGSNQSKIKNHNQIESILIACWLNNIK